MKLPQPFLFAGATLTKRFVEATKSLFSPFGLYFYDIVMIEDF